MNTYALVNHYGRLRIRPIAREGQFMVVPDGKGGFRPVQKGDWISILDSQDACVIFTGTESECETQKQRLINEKKNENASA